MSLSPLTIVPAVTADVVSINPFVVGGIALVILLALMLALLSFGGGREHS